MSDSNQSESVDTISNMRRIRKWTANQNVEKCANFEEPCDYGFDLIEGWREVHIDCVDGYNSIELHSIRTRFGKIVQSLPQPIPRISFANALRLNFIGVLKLIHTCGQFLVAKDIFSHWLTHGWLVGKEIFELWFCFVSFSSLIYFAFFVLQCMYCIAFGCVMKIRWELYGMSIHMTYPSNIRRCGAL